MEVYLNGEFMPYESAAVPVEDRGFTFADGIYEVVRLVGGRGLHLDAHLDRLTAGARALEIELPLSRGQLRSTLLETAQRNGVDDGTAYLQVTRGVAPRQHAFPEAARPTVVVITRPFGGIPEEMWRKGVTAVTAPDDRWGLCEEKTIGLLPNILAYERARRAGAYEAIYVRSGLVTEGTRSSVFVVLQGVVHTHPVDNILPGVTRARLIHLLRARGVEVRELAASVGQLREADEIFLTGTTSEALAVVGVDGQAIDEGSPGPIARLALQLYRQDLEELRAAG